MALTSLINTPSDGEGNKQAAFQAVFPSVAERTRAQIDALTTIINRTEDLVYESRSATEGTDIPKEVVAKASGTIILALHQLDNIIDDMSRWNVALTPMEKTFKRYLNQGVKLAEAQMVKAQTDTLPHIRYNAQLARVDLNDWVAVMQTGGKNHILGRGPTPYDAMASFDHAFFEGFDPKKADAPAVVEQKGEKKSRQGRKTPPSSSA